MNAVSLFSYFTFGVFLLCKAIFNLYWITEGWSPLDLFDGYLTDLFLLLLPITVGFLGLVFTYLRFGKKDVLLGNFGLVFVTILLLICSTFFHDDPMVNPESVYTEEYDDNNNIIKSGGYKPLSDSAKVGLLAFYSITGFISLLTTLTYTPTYTPSPSSSKNITAMSVKSANPNPLPSDSDNQSEKEFFPVLLLCFFFGMLGIHRFFVGKMGTGVLMLITLGGLGLWYSIDFILILTNHFKDSNGKIVMYKSSYNPRSNSQTDSIGVASEIEKFASLKERGIITEEEFNHKKKQLLGL